MRSAPENKPNWGLYLILIVFLGWAPSHSREHDAEKARERNRESDRKVRKLAAKLTMKGSQGHNSGLTLRHTTVY